MSKCAGPLSDCVNALQEILENLIKIQEDIVSGPISDFHMVSKNKQNKKDCICDCDDDTNRNAPINGTPEDGTDCKPYENDDDCQDKPWYCLPPPKSQAVDDECLSQDYEESSQNADDEECDENETTSNSIDPEPGDECFDKLSNFRSNTDGYQRIIAVRENCDGSVSKIYALRKNMRPPKITARRVDDYLNELPANDPNRRVARVNREDISDKSSLQSFRYRNKNRLKEKKKNCDCLSNRKEKGAWATQKNSTPLKPNADNYRTPQALINSVHDDICTHNPFEELQSIIEKERKRIDSVCNSEKLLSSIEKERRANTDRGNDKGNKNFSDKQSRNASFENFNDRRPNNNEPEIRNPQSALQQLKPKKVNSRLHNPLTEDEAVKLLDQLIDTTIVGFDKIAKSLKCQCQRNLSKSNLNESNNPSCDLEKLKKYQEETELKINCLRICVHELLVNMSKLLSDKIDVPEMQEIANELKDCRSNSKLNK